MKYRVLLAAILAVSVVLGSFGAVSADQTFMIQAAQDAWVNEANPAANYGNSTYMSVKDRSGLAEGYLRFSQADLNTFAIQTVASASVFLYQYQGTNSPGDSINVHSIASGWDESTVTWDNKPGYDAIPVSSLTVSDDSNTTGWREWTGLGNIISSWTGNSNFGLAFENNNDLKKEELYARFYTSEYSNTSMRPYLKVTAAFEPIGKVTAAPEPISMVLFSIGGGVLGLRRWRRCRS